MVKTSQDLVMAAKASIKEISAEKARQMLAEGAIALDVREAEEHQAGHITPSQHIPRGLLEFQIGQHPNFQDKTKPIVVYCKSGGRSALATAVLQELGFTNVCSLEGGFDNWQQVN